MTCSDLSSCKKLLSPLISDTSDKDNLINDYYLIVWPNSGLNVS